MESQRRRPGGSQTDGKIADAERRNVVSACVPAAVADPQRRFQLATICDDLPTAR